MVFLNKLFKKYNIFLLCKIILYEIFYVISQREIPLFDLTQSKNKKFHLSISTPFYFLSLISKINFGKSKSIFIDFGCGDGKVIRYLAKNKIFFFYKGYEIKKKLIQISKKKNNFNSVYFEEKNLLTFSKQEKIFNFINKKNIKQVNLYFYNPFDLKIVNKIIKCFKNDIIINIILLGFKKYQVTKITKHSKLKLTFKKDTLYVLKNKKL